MEQLALVSDAIPYHGHFKFFIDNLGRGVYPLWDPIRNCGVPNEFFLRRIGEFNPLFLLILVLTKMGLSFNYAYLAFLAVYFFIGMTGFYLLAKALFKDRTLAFLAYILLMFSSLGTRLFASYIFLLFVPMIWFAYFWVSFTQQPKSYKCLGITFTLMVIVTTYIPFYFLTALLTFLILFSLIYAKQLGALLKRYFAFIKVKKFLVGFCVLALLFSLLPGIMLYKEGAKRQFVLPIRHSNSPTSNVLGVNENRTEPGIFAHLKVDKLIGNLKEMQMNVFYFPLFVYLLFLLGAGVKVNKRILLWLLWIFGLFLIGSPEATSVNRFLFERIFFFKYFRNLRFFLWVAILPGIILLAVEYFRSFRSLAPVTRKQKIFPLIFIFIAHLGFVIFLYSVDGVLLSSFAVVFLSFLCFCWLVLRPRGHSRWLALFLLAIVFVHAQEVFYYLSLNSQKADARYKSRERTPLRYNRPYLDFSFKRSEKKILRKEDPDFPVELRPNSMYIATAQFQLLSETIDPFSLKAYSNYKFYLYENVENSQGTGKDTGRIKTILNKGIPRVIVSPALKDRPSLTAATSADSLQAIKRNSEEFEVLDHDVNSLKLRTRFSRDKFLVYTDNYYHKWNAFVNGKKVELYKANLAFKGVVLPEGENTVLFRFGSLRDYFFKYSLMILFHGVFWSMLVLWVQSRKKEDISDAAY